MEKLKQTDTQTGKQDKLDNIFMDLFTPEFLQRLPLEQIETVINNLEQIESTSETIPPEWLALKKVLKERDFLK